MSSSSEAVTGSGRNEGQDGAHRAVRVESPTEEVNQRTVDIDLQSTEEALRLLNAEDALVAAAVSVVLPSLALLVDEAAARVESGGRVHYFGAGTSGRLAVLDAAELWPTFGIGNVVVAHHAGGTAALLAAVEGAEDSVADGATAAADVTAADVAIGLTASGRTPYVGGALAAARRAGAFTALMTANPGAELSGVVHLVLAADTGPEALTGSTRLKAGTAQKLMLNGFSTVLMMRLGHTYSNLMIDMRATNAKLHGRSVHLLSQASGAPVAFCAEALVACGDIKTALLFLLTSDTERARLDVSSSATPDLAHVRRCREALAVASGNLREALRNYS